MSAVLAVGFLAAALLPASAQALTWTAVPTPNIKPTLDNDLLGGVSCVSAADCVAVGYYYGVNPGGAPESSFAESWNGSRWSVVPTPAPADRTPDGVSCVSADWCVAVGSQEIKGKGSLLRESWNGTKWKVMPGGQAQGSAVLLGVSCVTAANCIAVGQPGGSADALAESWNGQSWSKVPTPAPAAGFDSLSAVSCYSATACIAVGTHYYGAGDVDSAPLAESWNGSDWSVVPVPSTDKDASLLGVSCVSASFCAAAGSYPVGQNANSRTLIEMWNGSSWSAAPAITRLSETDGVSCVSSADCWAVGFTTDYPSSNLNHSIAEYWDGSTWSAKPLPQAGGTKTSNALNTVSCPSASACVAAGDRGATGSSGLGYNLALTGK